MAQVRALTLDSLALTRLDLLKVDVEGMELDVLMGAAAVVAAQHPIMIIEYVKSDRQRLTTALEGWGYRQFPFGLNILAVHGNDPCGSRITVRDKS